MSQATEQGCVMFSLPVPSAPPAPKENLKDKECGKKRNHYPVRLFLFKNLKEKTSIKELIQAYYSLHGKQLSSRAFTKAANQLADEGKILLERREQLWLFPITQPIPNTRDEQNSNGTISMLGRNIKRVHSTHKIKLSMPYRGDQPKEGGIEKAFGRYRTARQYIFHRGIHTVGAYKNKIVIWVRNPSGVLTVEQRINAKAEGYKTLTAFAKEHNITLEGYLEKVELSHHVVENDSLNNELKKLTNKYGDEIYKRLGTHECQTSHPGRIEHEGRAREDRIVRGDQVAIGLEKLTLDFPEQFEKMVKINAEFTENLKLHMGVLKDIRDAVRDMKETKKKEESI
jgi:hypothetical protein